MFLILVALVCFNINSFADTAWVMGGFKSATSTGTSVKIKCSDVQSKKCYGVNTDGETIIGVPVKVWVNTNNENEPLGGETTGTGYINAIFLGYDIPNNPNSGINLDITPATITVYTYSEWLSHITP